MFQLDRSRLIDDLPSHASNCATHLAIRCELHRRDVFYVIRDEIQPRKFTNSRELVELFVGRVFTVTIIKSIQVTNILCPVKIDGSSHKWKTD